MFVISYILCVIFYYLLFHLFWWFICFILGLKEHKITLSIESESAQLKARLIELLFEHVNIYPLLFLLFLRLFLILKIIYLLLMPFTFLIIIKSWYNSCDESFPAISRDVVQVDIAEKLLYLFEVCLFSYSSYILLLQHLSYSLLLVYLHTIISNCGLCSKAWSIVTVPLLCLFSFFLFFYFAFLMLIECY